MMKFDKNALGKQARELGFARDTFEKVCRLNDVLNYIESNSFLKSKLALKGGTAINLTMMDMPRLSIDIDLDYVGSIDRAQMLEDRETIRTHIAKYAMANDYRISQKSKYYFALDSLVYDYKNSGDVKDNLKIEINYMLRTHALELQERKVNIPWIAEVPSVLCVNPIEIYSTKIVALLTRTAARDLYDVHNMISHKLFSEKEMLLMCKCVDFYSAVGAESAPQEYSFDNIDSITPQKIKRDLYPVLRRGEHFDLKEVQDDTKAFLKDMLVVDASTVEFWNRFNKGEYRPELIFGGFELERISNHPMALWKCISKRTS